MGSDGRVCVVTGANSGTGYVTALELARGGANVVMMCRNAEKGEAARAAIVAETGNERVELIVVDLAEMADVRRAVREFTERHSTLDVLVNNAGGVTQTRRESSEGLEAMFAGNYLGHFLLTTSLLDQLKAAGNARIINVSSMAHKGARIDFDDLQNRSGKNAMRGYGQSKLAQILFTYELAERLRGTGVTVNAMHPGAVASGFKNGTEGVIKAVVGAFYAAFGISPEKGADTILHLANSPEVADVSGKYFIKRRPVATSKVSYDVEVRRRLWAVSEKLIADVAG
ncbi:SDR family oxidoreductase [Saccharopolyspora flava]|uniref:NAD(P)-dependent dehydrogenase, short-chain alcohol dehydrogenase family n=1 Tax=Saccharopolyspora flava TaxID=95161 RepID=A0A1I6QF77_9PSEU|nr:SDR family oxidoreductase [Saccharopolyspora flava]SFS50995.1 NAD(P)-dependent dehydrogenase, short-chain alcohol dehydrogenase family [Saccharopolyspora flava]